MFSYYLSKLSLNTIFGKYNLIFRFYFVSNGKTKNIINFRCDLLLFYFILLLDIHQAFKKWSFWPSHFFWPYLLAQLLVPTSGAAMEQFQLAPVVGTEKWRVQDGNTLVSTTLCPVQDAHPVRPVKQLLQFPVLPTSATAVQGAPEGYPKVILLLRWNRIDNTRKEL